MIVESENGGSRASSQLQCLLSLLSLSLSNLGNSSVFASSRLPAAARSVTNGPSQIYLDQQAHSKSRKHGPIWNSFGPFGKKLFYRRTYLVITILGYVNIQNSFCSALNTRNTLALSIFETREFY